jgi:predicted  nucleic acid-binding Zn-ribbon protein
MRDEARIEKLGSRIHSLEHRSVELQKQLRDMNQLLCKLLDEMDGKERMPMQKTDRDILP